jgi:MFS family permease
MKQSHQKRASRSLSILFGAVPFAFALVRAVRTGDDFRYLWVAFGALLGATIAIAMRKAERTRTFAGLGLTAFVLATLLATAVALFLGTQFGSRSVGGRIWFWRLSCGELRALCARAIMTCRGIEDEL